MFEIRREYAPEFTKNAVKLSYASTKTVMEAARDLGISDGSYTGGGKSIRLKGKRQGLQHWIFRPEFHNSDTRCLVR